MYYLEQLTVELAEAVNKALGQKAISASDFVLPPDKTMGDLSLPCFAAAKALGVNPAEVAKNLTDKLTHPAVAQIKAAGPYANITFSPVINAGIVQSILKKPAIYGKQNWGAKKRIMQEYANLNTHKEVHIGHVRNIAYGDAVNRTLAANGFMSIPVSYINDFGIHVAKTLWHYRKTNAIEPRENKGFFLGQLYTASVKAMGDDPVLKAEVGEVKKAIEGREGDIYKLWKKTRKWSLDQFASVYKDLDVTFKDTFYESDFLDEGLRVTKNLKEKGILIESRGAIIADLEQYKLGVLPVIRSDGTALYPVADFGLTFHKVKKYKLDTSIWVIDIRQRQHFDQLFKVLELAGLKADLQHLLYDFVKLPSGMMSSRSGNVITYEDIKKQTIAEAVRETKQRHVDWPEKKIANVARVLAFGALKFEMIKVSGEKVITFDVATALRFDGFTAGYIQYAYARIQSIVRKTPAAVKKARPDFATLTESRERNLIMTLGRFPDIVRKAGETYQPSEIAKYLYELAQLYSDYYHVVPMLNDKTLPAVIAISRVELSKAVAVVIKRGLDLLGIEVIEEM